MNGLISLATSFFDSTPFRFFFAAWTGIYLVQIIYRGDSTWKQDLSIIALFVVIGLYVLTPNNNAS